MVEAQWLMTMASPISPTLCQSVNFQETNDTPTYYLPCGVQGVLGKTKVIDNPFEPNFHASVVRLL